MSVSEISNILQGEYDHVLTGLIADRKASEEIYIYVLTHMKRQVDEQGDQTYSDIFPISLSNVLAPFLHIASTHSIDLSIRRIALQSVLLAQKYGWLNIESCFVDIHTDNCKRDENQSVLLGSIIRCICTFTGSNMHIGDARDQLVYVDQLASSLNGVETTLLTGDEGHGLYSAYNGLLKHIIVYPSSEKLPTIYSVLSSERASHSREKQVLPNARVDGYPAVFESLPLLPVCSPSLTCLGDQHILDFLLFPILSHVFEHLGHVSDVDISQLLNSLSSRCLNVPVHVNMDVHYQYYLSHPISTLLSPENSVTLIMPSANDQNYKNRITQLPISRLYSAAPSPSPHWIPTCVSAVNTRTLTGMVPGARTGKAAVDSQNSLLTALFRCKHTVANTVVTSTTGCLSAIHHEVYHTFADFIYLVPDTPESLMQLPQFSTSERTLPMLPHTRTPGNSLVIRQYILELLAQVASAPVRILTYLRHLSCQQVQNKALTHFSHFISTKSLLALQNLQFARQQFLQYPNYTSLPVPVVSFDSPNHTNGMHSIHNQLGKSQAYLQRVNNVSSINSVAITHYHHSMTVSEVGLSANQQELLLEEVLPVAAPSSRVVEIVTTQLLQTHHHVLTNAFICMQHVLTVLPKVSTSEDALHILEKHTGAVVSRIGEMLVGVPIAPPSKWLVHPEIYKPQQQSWSKAQCQGVAMIHRGVLSAALSTAKAYIQNVGLYVPGAARAVQRSIAAHAMVTLAQTNMPSTLQNMVKPVHLRNNLHSNLMPSPLLQPLIQTLTSLLTTSSSLACVFALDNCPVALQIHKTTFYVDMQLPPFVADSVFRYMLAPLVGVVHGQHPGGTSPVEQTTTLQPVGPGAMLMNNIQQQPIVDVNTITINSAQDLKNVLLKQENSSLFVTLAPNTSYPSLPGLTSYAAYITSTPPPSALLPVSMLLTANTMEKKLALLSILDLQLQVVTCITRVASHIEMMFASPQELVQDDTALCSVQFNEQKTKSWGILETYNVVKNARDCNEVATFLSQTPRILKSAVSECIRRADSISTGILKNQIGSTKLDQSALLQNHVYASYTPLERLLDCEYRVDQCLQQYLPKASAFDSSILSLSQDIHQIVDIPNQWLHPDTTSGIDNVEDWGRFLCLQDMTYICQYRAHTGLWPSCVVELVSTCAKQDTLEEVDTYLHSLVTDPTVLHVFMHTKADAVQARLNIKPVFMLCISLERWFRDTNKERISTLREHRETMLAEALRKWERKRAREEVTEASKPTLIWTEPSLADPHLRRGFTVTPALRNFLDAFQLEGETGEIDRVVEAFAVTLFSQCRGVLATPDSAHILAFSLVLLSTDLHKAAGAKSLAMDFTDYKRNTRCTNDGVTLPDAYLLDCYNDQKARGQDIKADHNGVEQTPFPRFRDLITATSSGSGTNTYDSYPTYTHTLPASLQWSYVDGKMAITRNGRGPWWAELVDVKCTNNKTWECPYRTIFPIISQLPIQTAKLTNAAPLLLYQLNIPVMLPYKPHIQWKQVFTLLNNQCKTPSITSTLAKTLVSVLKLEIMHMKKMQNVEAPVNLSQLAYVNKQTIDSLVGSVVPSLTATSVCSNVILRVDKEHIFTPACLAFAVHPHTSTVQYELVQNLSKPVDLEHIQVHTMLLPTLFLNGILHHALFTPVYASYSHPKDFQWMSTTTPVLTLPTLHVYQKNTTQQPTSPTANTSLFSAFTGLLWRNPEQTSPPVPMKRITNTITNEVTYIWYGSSPRDITLPSSLQQGVKEFLATQIQCSKALDTFLDTQEDALQYIADAVKSTAVCSYDAGLEDSQLASLSLSVLARCLYRQKEQCIEQTAKMDVYKKLSNLLLGRIHAVLECYHDEHQEESKQTNIVASNNVEIHIAYIFDTSNSTNTVWSEHFDKLSTNYVDNNVLRTALHICIWLPELALQKNSIDAILPVYMWLNRLPVSILFYHVFHITRMYTCVFEYISNNKHTSSSAASLISLASIANVCWNRLIGFYNMKNSTPGTQTHIHASVRACASSLARSIYTFITTAQADMDLDVYHAFIELLRVLHTTTMDQYKQEDVKCCFYCKKEEVLGPLLYCDTNVTSQLCPVQIIHSLQLSMLTRESYYDYIMQTLHATDQCVAIYGKDTIAPLLDQLLETNADRQVLYQVLADIAFESVEEIMLVSTTVSKTVEPTCSHFYLYLHYVIQLLYMETDQIFLTQVYLQLINRLAPILGAFAKEAGKLVVSGISGQAGNITGKLSYLTDKQIVLLSHTYSDQENLYTKIHVVKPDIKQLLTRVLPLTSSDQSKLDTLLQ